MITIVHGNDIVGSRKFFLEEKSKLANAVLLAQADVNLTSLAQLLDGGGLFEEARTIFIEQFLSEKKKSSEKEAVITYLAKAGGKHSIMLWEGKEMAASAFTPFKGANIKSFKLPSSLFAFLDALKPGNGANLIKLFHKSLESTEPEMIFFMMIRQFRILLAMIRKDNETISEVARLAPWQRGRLESQAKLFKKEQLLEIYANLFKIEIGQKTGGLSASLVYSVDFLLLGI